MDSETLQFLIFISLFILAGIDGALLDSEVGSFKRGIRIWEEPISPFVLNYLFQIDDGHNLNERKPRIEGFIRRQKKEIQISLHRPRWRFIYYVGYVNLAEDSPTLQFRSAIFSHIFLFYYLLLIVWRFAPLSSVTNSFVFVIFFSASLVIEFMYYRSQTRRIRKLLQNQIKK
ncbi:MAG: hypothetical protein QNJ45_21065 [Ardenticatenaceae bacterium]|nr:hypothetical protein [Ardenticatenaceae bacterium]